MTKCYKNPETAIRNIKKGLPLHRSVFSDYWNNKDVFLQLAKAGGYIQYRQRDKFSKWFSTWCWDESFVTEIFNAQFELWNGSRLIGRLSWLLDYLPDSITSSERYFSICNWNNRFEYRLTGKVREKHDTAVYMSKRNSDLKYRKLFEENAEILKPRLQTISDLINHFEIAPESIMSDKNYCVQMACQMPWLTTSLTRWHDDIDFVIACNTIRPDYGAYPFSYRIRKIVRNEDPKTSLLKYQLETTLAKKTGVQATKLNKI